MTLFCAYFFCPAVIYFRKGVKKNEKRKQYSAAISEFAARVF